MDEVRLFEIEQRQYALLSIVLASLTAQIGLQGIELEEAIRRIREIHQHLMERLGRPSDSATIDLAVDYLQAVYAPTRPGWIPRIVGTRPEDDVEPAQD